MNDFYLTLLSDSSLDIFPTNKQNSFTVRLDHPININEENWEVALVEIMTSAQVLNISEENNFFYLVFLDPSYIRRHGFENVTEMCRNTNACDKVKLIIPPGNYVSPSHLAQEMQSSINAFENGLLEHVNVGIGVVFDENSKRMKIICQDERQTRLQFSKEFGKLLGLNPSLFGKPIGNEKDSFIFNADLNAPHDTFFIYSDIADFTNVGDVKAPILRIVPFNHTKYSTYFHTELKNLHYVPVAKSFIDQVHISIKTATGKSVPFMTGKSLVKLHFRHKQFFQHDINTLH